MEDGHFLSAISNQAPSCLKRLLQLRYFMVQSERMLDIYKQTYFSTLVSSIPTFVKTTL